MNATKYMIFTTPRTGSTHITEWLSNYLHQYCGYKNTLYEYFNPTNCYERSFSGEIREITFAKDVITDARTRLDWLRASPHTYLIKYRLDFATVETDAYCFSQYVPICLERTNHYEQILSWGIASTLNIWGNLPQGLQIPNASLAYPRSVFDTIVGHLRQYREKLDHIDARIRVSYEEVAANPYRILDALDLPRRDFHYVTSYHKLHSDHECIFTNIDEVRAWFVEIEETL